MSQAKSSRVFRFAHWAATKTVGAVGILVGTASWIRGKLRRGAQAVPATRADRRLEKQRRKELWRKQQTKKAA